MPTSATTRQRQIRLVCGLGNPGPQYEHTRHNVGFATIDVLAGRSGVTFWKSESGCLTCRVTVTAADGAAREVVLAKPQDYMNTSGGPLSKLMRQLRVAPQELLVVHDEVDLAAGELRVKLGGGLNAHNGLRSIADKLGTRDFARLQVGIGRPPGRMQVADYVLRQLKGGLRDELCLSCEDAASLCERCLTQGVEATRS
ncbi:aminoacyl-tRNA hydrolase [Olsenella sp. HMSC062G07]|uniref:aminoacyl-tRNA hydrolase n=1 Tax=Olsenella sp. HMSC062G07 TaxID=1739330 RepID=UPI000A57A9C2|nr:aminoacyl-tRNA hydrolase [Olsenella sp. HMSC062G07]